MRLRRNPAALLLLAVGLLAARPGQAGADSTGVSTYPPRGTKTGMTAGAISGAVVGTASFTLLGYLIEVLDDSNEEFSTGQHLLFGVVGGIAGALGGGLIGADVGALFYRDGRDRRRFPETPPIGRFSLEAGWADFTARSDAESGGWARATLTSHFRPWLAVGPELSFQTTRPRNWRVAGAVRLEPYHGRLSPYAIGSLGPNFWPDSETRLGADFGGGLRIGSPGARLSFQLEGRHHWNQHNAVEPGTYRFVTVGAGITRSW